jgi:large repetitive protein
VEVVPETSPLDTVTTVGAAVTGTFGQTVGLKATLALRTMTSLSGRTLSFIVGSTSAGRSTTNTAGMAIVNFPIGESLSVGPHLITATYAGNRFFNASDGSNMLNVTKGNTTLIVPARTANIGSSGGKVTLQATLKRSVGSASLSARIVEFKVDGVSIGTAITSSSGIASTTYDVPATTHLGSHTTTAEFAGDARYNPSFRNGLMTVKAVATLVVPKRREVRAHT